LGFFGRHLFVFKSFFNQQSQIFWEDTMARPDANLLDTNDLFPEMEIRLVSEETMSLPGDFGEGYAVILLYRGYW
jgi:hypothetical protein